MQTKNLISVLLGDQAVTLDTIDCAIAEKDEETIAYMASWLLTNKRLVKQLRVNNSLQLSQLSSEDLLTLRDVLESHNSHIPGLNFGNLIGEVKDLLKK